MFSDLDHQYYHDDFFMELAGCYLMGICVKSFGDALLNLIVIELDFANKINLHYQNVVH